MSVSDSGSVILENEFFKAAIHPFGAELHSLFSKKLNIELIWQAGVEWPKHSPVLFPVVGGLKNDVIHHDDFTLHLKRHGFAREMNFKIQEVTDKKAVFILEESEATLKLYPFKFLFSIEYLLEDDALQVNISVKNTGNKKLYCSYGAHPAFRVPLYDEEAFEDYQLSFNPSNDEWLRNPLKNNLIADNPVTMSTPNGQFALSHELFAEDAIVLKKPGFNSVSLEHKSKGYGIKMQCESWPYFGIWSAKNADFVCLEPWQGIADTETSTGELREKEGILLLEAGRIHSTSYIIELIR